VPELTENPFLLGLSCNGYVNRILRSIRPNDLEQAVLLLNHDCVVRFSQLPCSPIRLPDFR
jgi:hypothetical protein